MSPLDRRTLLFMRSAPCKGTKQARRDGLRLVGATGKSRRGRRTNDGSAYSRAIGLGRGAGGHEEVFEAPSGPANHGGGLPRGRDERALDYGAKGDPELVPWPSVPPRAPLEQALSHRMRHEGGHEVSDNRIYALAKDSDYPQSA